MKIKPLKHRTLDELLYLRDALRVQIRQLWKIYHTRTLAWTEAEDVGMELITKHLLIKEKIKGLRKTMREIKRRVKKIT